jgi:hypothetical protein
VAVTGESILSREDREVSDKTGWKKAVGSGCGTRDGAPDLGPLKENNYALESISGYIVLGCWELEREFRLITR